MAPSKYSHTPQLGTFMAWKFKWVHSKQNHSLGLSKFKSNFDCIASNSDLVLTWCQSYIKSNSNCTVSNSDLVLTWYQFWIKSNFDCTVSNSDVVLTWS